MASSQHNSYLKTYLKNHKTRIAAEASRTKSKSRTTPNHKTESTIKKSAKERVANRQKQHELKLLYSKQPGTAPIEWLPDELILQLFKYLGPQDLLSCGRVCKRWHILASDNLLWQNIYKQYASTISKGQKKQKSVKIPKNPPATFWKSFCVQRGAEYRNTRAIKAVQQKKVNPFTGLPRGIQEAIQKSGLRWVLSFIDNDSQEHTVICQDAFYFNMSVCIRWYNFDLPSVHRIQKLRIYSGNPIFFDEKGQAVPNSPLQRSILYERSFKLGGIISSNTAVSSDNIITVYDLADGLFIATWKDDNNLAFISMSFHLDNLVDRCLHGTANRPWMPSPHKPFRDDIDRKYGLHSYSCTLELRNVRTSLWSQQFRNLHCLEDFRDGFAVMQLIDPNRSFERSWIEKKISLPWKTEVLKGIVKDVCLMDVTLLDDQQKPMWCSCGMTKIRSADDADVTYEYDGDYFLITYADKQLGKVIMILIWEESSKKFYITSLQIHLSLNLINYWFGTRY